MAIRTFTTVPQAVTAELIANTAVSPSPLTGSAQTLARVGMRWLITHSWHDVIGDERGEVMALIAFLKGQENRVRLSAMDNPANGAYGGSPTVNGASQTGSSLAIGGAGTVTDWIKAGDYFSTSVNGEHELKMATQDSSSSGGNATLVFEPPLRDSPANGSAIFVGDGGTKPRGLFMMAENAAGWSSSPGGKSNISVQFSEDIFGTL